MAINGISSSIDIAISGLRAESTRMNVISANIANSNVTETPDGGPYRRQDVTLATDAENLGGVTIQGVAGDFSTAFKEVYQPGHPQADENGYVRMPNVELPIEMMNLVTASRAYEANAAVLKRYKNSIDVTLELLR